MNIFYLVVLFTGPLADDGLVQCAGTWGLVIIEKPLESLLTPLICWS